MTQCASMCLQEALDSEEVADADGLARSSSNISQMSEFAGKNLGCQSTRLCPYGGLAGAVMLVTTHKMPAGPDICIANSVGQMLQLAVDAYSAAGPLLMPTLVQQTCEHCVLAGLAGVAVFSAPCSLGSCRLRWYSRPRPAISSQPPCHAVQVM